uniref:RIIa domain-containing protein n=1 Tax=Romanomermis culicivorax TaxID=13658 RepID=A0A915HK79_ROMCU
MFENNDSEVIGGRDLNSEQYCRVHNIPHILRNAVAEICLYKPHRPITFFKEYFQKLEAEII